MRQAVKVFLLFSAALVLSWSLVAPAEEVEDEREFSYVPGSPNGPEHWGEMRKDWKNCSCGQQQSPIDVVHERVRVAPGLGMLKRSYKPANATLENRGHDIMEAFASMARILSSNSATGTLHLSTINGHRFELEAHMVHVSADNRTAVVGIMYKFGRPDPFLSELKEYIEEISDEKEAERAVGMVNAEHMKLGSNEYYRYMGSLTVPPCTEGIVWTVIKKIRTVSREQVELLREAVHDNAEENARPLQPLHGRQIEFYTPCDGKN